MLRRFTAGVVLDPETLALEVIQEVGPGGDYLAHEHTLRYFRDFWQPALFSRQRWDDWARHGARRLGARLRDRTIALVESHWPEPLPAGIQAEIDDILAAASPPETIPGR